MTKKTFDEQIFLRKKHFGENEKKKNNNNPRKMLNVNLGATDGSSQSHPAYNGENFDSSTCGEMTVLFEVITITNFVIFQFFVGHFNCHVLKHNRILFQLMFSFFLIHRKSHHNLQPPLPI